jgi:hypothetical protein
MFSTSNTHTGANGDTANFTDANARANLVDHEADPATVYNTGEARGTGLFSSSDVPSQAEVGSGQGLREAKGANWREPESRGAAGDFDEWNPRGEFGSGGANTPGASLAEKAKGMFHPSL